MKPEVSIFINKAFAAVSTEDFAQIIFTVRDRLKITSHEFCSAFGISERVLEALEEGCLDWNVIKKIFDTKRDYRLALYSKPSRQPDEVLIDK